MADDRNAHRRGNVPDDELHPANDGKPLSWPNQDEAQLACAETVREWISLNAGDGEDGAEALVIVGEMRRCPSLYWLCSCLDWLVNVEEG